MARSPAACSGEEGEIFPIAHLSRRARLHPLSETITITGGGLTGLSLAIALRREQVPVLLYEAGQYPRHRVCGEFISGVSEQTLHKLGIASSLADAKLHRSLSWFRGDTLLRQSELPVPAMAISRYLLDDRLQKLAIQSGAELLTNTRRKIPQNLLGEVCSTGRKPNKGEWIGLKAHIRGMTTSAHLEMHSGTNGYLGITPVEDGWLNVCGLFRIDKSISALRAELLPAYLLANGNRNLSAKIAAAEWREGSFSAVAGFQLGKQNIIQNALCLGDSHSIIPPFTGNGMSMALQSAETALPHLVAYSHGEISWANSCENIRLALNKQFRKRLSTAQFLHPFFFHPLAKPILRFAPIQPLLHLLR